MSTGYIIICLSRFVLQTSGADLLSKNVKVALGSAKFKPTANARLMAARGSLTESQTQPLKLAKLQTRPPHEAKLNRAEQASQGAQPPPIQPGAVAGGHV